ncbi:hypothetical protein DFJ73DRAFT_766677 [Zopfochytrium polystomum]|nr:hypothetical protein DFJ73DRAFT_766677 [Zopfochytrium polystomum]
MAPPSRSRRSPAVTLTLTLTLLAAFLLLLLLSTPRPTHADPSPLIIHHRSSRLIVTDKILPARTGQKKGEVHSRNTDCMVGKVTVVSWLRRYDLCEVDVGIAELCEKRDDRGAYDLAWDAHRQAGYNCGGRQKSFKGNEHHTVCKKLLDGKKYKDLAGMYSALKCQKSGPSRAAPPPEVQAAMARRLKKAAEAKKRIEEAKKKAEEAKKTAAAAAAAKAAADAKAKEAAKAGTTSREVKGSSTDGKKKKKKGKKGKKETKEGKGKKGKKAAAEAGDGADKKKKKKKKAKAEAAAAAAAVQAPAAAAPATAPAAAPATAPVAAQAPVAATGAK